MDDYKTIEEIRDKVRKIDNLLFNKEIELDDMERKSLEIEREDLLYYLE